jgi:hypothetical protein
VRNVRDWRRAALQEWQEWGCGVSVVDGETHVDGSCILKKTSFKIRGSLKR